MSQHSTSQTHDPHHRQRSDALIALLARCPEHLFSTDDDEMASILGAAAAPVQADAAEDKAALDKAA
ncbi:MAG: hypothetical protein KKH72_00770 [Alphaproteobacteria bacterium]|nr:hypothetical protein [Alphaproteobacteria bacterium]